MARQYNVWCIASLISSLHVACAPAQVMQKGTTLSRGEAYVATHASLSYAPGLEVSLPAFGLYDVQGRKKGLETRIGIGSGGALAGAKYQWKGNHLSKFAAAIAIDLQAGVFPILPIFAVWGQGTLSVPMSYRLNPRWEMYGAPGVGGGGVAYASAVSMSDGFIYGLTLSQTLGLFFDYSKGKGFCMEMFVAGAPIKEQSFESEQRLYFGLSLGIVWHKIRH